MASLLRQIVSGPRARHPEAGLDLCYVTDNIVVTSGPSSVWPRKAYRNPVNHLVAFLDKKHGEEWAIFEFRAEGTGYPDEEVYNRVHHFPWPDHHPPPFAIIPNLMAAMRNWLQEDAREAGKQRVAVVHCKAGKGRSGTVACSYLISQEAWRMEDALKRFTLRRMRNGFGDGVSIPSQLRWVRYVNKWTNKMNKRYIERPMEVVEVHVWGLRSGVKVCVEGFVEDGKRIMNFHTFTRDEKTNVDADFNSVSEFDPLAKSQTENLVSPNDAASSSKTQLSTAEKEGIQNVILRPSEPIRLPTSDVNIDFERRNKSGYTGFAMVTSLAHVWFNAYFEGGYEGNDSGLFEIEWEAMDGIKGSARKGIKAFDRMKVIWKYSELGRSQSVEEPKKGEPIKEGAPADWRGEGDPETVIGAEHSGGVLNSGHRGASPLTLGQMSSDATNKLMGKDLGLRKSHDASADVSRASSVKDETVTPPDSKKTNGLLEHDSDSEEEGVKPHVPDEHDISNRAGKHESHDDDRQDTATGKYLELGLAKVSNILAKMKGSDLDHETESSK